MQDIKSLAQLLGLTERELRYRLELLDGAISKHVKQGKNRKILIDQGGVALLQRVKYWEEQDMPVLAAVEKVKTELQSQLLAPQTKMGETLETSALIEALRLQISKLEEDKLFLQERVKTLEELLSHRLPGLVEPSWKTDIEYLRQTVDAQRQEIAELRQALAAMAPIHLQLQLQRPWWRRLLHR